MKKLGILFLTVIMIMLFAMSVSAKDNVNKMSDIIKFGSYPQTAVKDETLTEKLNSLVPEWDKWISYGYYSGDGSYGSMQKGDWMKYVDITYENNRYRGVRFNNFRPASTDDIYSISNSEQVKNSYYTGATYWFKYQPIEWKILDAKAGLVMCELIIDAQPYCNTIYWNGNTSDLTYSLYNDFILENYACDYETSSIRNWLNNEFYNIAFTNLEKSEITYCNLDNSGYYSLSGFIGFEPLNSNNTKDKIFLLSFKEAHNNNYGFSNSSVADLKRKTKGSDYARAQGLRVESGTSGWLLRTPGTISANVCCVDYRGHSIGFCNTNQINGIRPALILNDINKYIHYHVYSEKDRKETTCESDGEITYVCSCGDSYKEIVKAFGHDLEIYSKTDVTCTTNGTIHYRCTKCNFTKTEIYFSTNHINATTDPGKAPTTTEVGYTAGKYCPDCKTWIEGHEEIPKLHSHIYSSSTIIKEPTCTEEGIKKYICACGESYTMTLSKTEHVFRYVDVKKNATCTEPGLEWTFCDVCELEVEREIPATGHTVIDYTRRATPDSDGAYVTACDVCNEVFKSISFGRPTEFKLSTAKYTYDGKTKTPKLTVETSDGVVLKEGVDYEIELPSGRKAVGVYTYRVVFKGDFLGEKKVSYQILPGKTSKITATQSTSLIKLTWKKVTGADGYRVYQYNSKTGKYEKIKTTTGTSYTVKKLKAGTTYKFAVKAYTKDNGETLWAASYKTITTGTKPATPTVKATAGSKQATISWNKVTGATGYVVYMQDDFGDYNKIGSTKKTSYTRKKLTKGKTYYFRVRAYKTVDGKNIYGGYKTVKVKVK